MGANNVLINHKYVIPVIPKDIDITLERIKPKLRCITTHFLVDQQNTKSCKYVLDG